MHMKNRLTLLVLVLGGLAWSFSPVVAQRLKIVPDADTLFVCPDSSIALQAIGAVNYRWAPTALATPSNGPSVKVKPNQNTWVFVEAFVNGQLERDSVLLILARPSISLSALDPLSVCRGVPVRLRATTNTRGQGISWSPSAGLSSATGAAVTARPANTTTYTATVDVTGCKATASISVTIAPQRADISNPDTVFACKGSRTTLLATTSTGTAQNLSWRAADNSVSAANVLSLTVQPRRTTKYFATFVTPQCTTVDSVLVVIDSLPVQTITLDPQKEAYCQGEIVVAKSDTYENLAYPFIRHKWVPARIGPGAPQVDFQTPDTLWNMVIGTIDSVLLLRATRNRGCVDTARILVPVIKPKVITITPTNPVLCPGDAVQLQASFQGQGEIKWEPTTGLSCTDCRNPSARPTQTTNFTITVTEKGCPSSASREVVVLPPPALLVPSNPTICLGATIALNTLSDAGTTYRWTGPNNFTSTEALLRVSPAVTSSYRVTAQRGNCPAVTRDVTVTVIQPGTVSVPADQTICPNTPVTLTATGTGVNSAFTWRGGGQTSNQASITVSNLRQTTRFDLTYTWGPNCGTLTRSVTVNVTPVPTIIDFSFEPADARSAGVPLGDAVRVTATTSPTVPTGVTYSWFANDQPIPGNALTVEHLPTANPTVYKLRITTTGSNCVVELAAPPIAVVDPVFDIPNAFTPNNDNRNDFFNVVFRGNIQVREFQIFNRWGQLVYNNDNPSEGWDGTFNGNPAPSDVFLYKLVLLYPDGSERRKNGEVTLIR